MAKLDESDEEALFDSDEEAFISSSKRETSSSSSGLVESTPTTQFASQQELVVERVLGRKVLTLDDGLVEELYFIKWKGLAYLHASWERKEDIERVDLNAKQKLKRFFLTPQLPGIMGEIALTATAGEDGVEVPDIDEEDIEYFSPDYLEVQRIISCNSSTCVHSKARKPQDLRVMTGKKRGNLHTNSDNDDIEDSGISYLIKWRSLPYDECTWERWEDIQLFTREVWLFWQLQKPPCLPIHQLPFPALQDYKKLETSPYYGVSAVIPQDDEEIPFEGLQLRDYQLEGINWLLWNWWHRRSCILADEMGLGRHYFFVN
jgi:hypothetical protein